MKPLHALELKVPPVAVAVVAAAGMWFGANLDPLRGLGVPWRLPLAWSLTCIGGALALWGVIAFRRAQTTMNPTRPDATSRLVVSGAYRLSRNPMYVGILFALAAWGVYLEGLLPFLMLPLFVAYMTRFQILPEERILLEQFGHEYAAYMRSVRRWL